MVSLLITFCYSATAQDRGIESRSSELDPTTVESITTERLSKTRRASGAIARPSAPILTEPAPAADAAGFSGDEIGAYGQPEWVRHRRFATTRVHIQQDPWEASFEEWWRGRLSDGEWKHRLQEELEIGLPGRIQLDLYHTWAYEKDDAVHKDVSLEIRHGLADWGVIPLNPALYFEYKWTDPTQGGDVIEPKLLFGDSFGEWDYGLNLVYERELGGESTEEYQITQGLAKAVCDDISLGLEMKYVHETVEGGREDPEHKVLLGPSIQFRPAEHVHLDVVALAGLTEDAPDLEAWVVFGWEFGRVGGGGPRVRAPVSGMR